jgi:hypothetical protein
MLNGQNILAAARGAINERVDYEMNAVIKNILDPNTAPNKPRKLIVELALTPSADRDYIHLGVVVKTKLEPTTAINTSFSLYNEIAGGVKLVENTPQIPGQLELGGGEQDEPNTLIFGRVNND